MNADAFATYPESPTERDRWILAHRPQRNALDPTRPYAFFVEEEHAVNGEIVPVATIFLTNRECPWRCLMCDLWKNTLTTTVPRGAIPSQIAYALDQLPPACQIKLYNSGSFFDPHAIPPADYTQIASQVAAFERVIVECHPALVGDDCLQFRDLIAGQLEVAMGLETAHPQILEKLNKRMTLAQFAAAAKNLRDHRIDLRVFILVQPPFMEPSEALEWAKRSLDFAFNCGATAATLIPTRGGNGALDEFAHSGHFTPPKLSVVEAAVEYGLSLKQGRVFADSWDMDKTVSCLHCHNERVDRLRQMNLQQVVPNQIVCGGCGVHA